MEASRLGFDARNHALHFFDIKLPRIAQFDLFRQKALLRLKLAFEFDHASGLQCGPACGIAVKSLDFNVRRKHIGLIEDAQEIALRVERMNGAHDFGFRFARRNFHGEKPFAGEILARNGNRLADVQSFTESRFHKLCVCIGSVL